MPDLWCAYQHSYRAGPPLSCPPFAPALAPTDDSTARVWDLRSSACTHVLASRSSTAITALALAEDQVGWGVIENRAGKQGQGIRCKLRCSLQLPVHRSSGASSSAQLQLRPHHRVPRSPPLQGQPFCFTSNAASESVLCWDLRTRRCLYELATGNTEVCSMQVGWPAQQASGRCSTAAALQRCAVLLSAVPVSTGGTWLLTAAGANAPTCCLQWHAPSRSLFAVGDCYYIDRHGHDFEYGSMGGYVWPK